MEKGEPPSDDIEKEWLRKIRDEARKQQESDAARMVSAPFHAKTSLKDLKKKMQKKKKKGFCPRDSGHMSYRLPIDRYSHTF